MGQLRRLGPWPLYTASAPASGRGAIGVCPTVWAYSIWQAHADVPAAASRTGSGRMPVFTGHLM
jgi:hypothetical protein